MSAAIRSLLEQHGFKLEDGKWTHSDIRDMELDDATLTAASLPRVRTLIGLVQEHPSATRYSPLASPHTSKSGPAGKLVG
jgi:hypothetical protein